MSTATPATLRDPEALSRIGWALAAVVVLWPLLLLSGFDPALLLDPQNLKAMGIFLGGFLPPETSAEFLDLLLKATLETLAMATVGIALALFIAAPLAFILTQSLSVSRIGPGPGRWRGEAIRAIARMVLLVLRGIPEIVWALVFVRALGLGVTAGVLALAITYGGMLGKVYAEILESADTRGARALLEHGSSRSMALVYGLMPNAAQELVSYTVYRWECAVRASVIMGFVGAGGLGQLMDQSMKMLNGGESATILLVFLLLVLLADWISGFLRKLLA
ncbi:MAG: PhnE/PtxC family ABC transporter permease [Burkholderiales bacterium]